MRAPKRFKTIKKERYFAIAKPLYKDVNGVWVTTGEYEYLTNLNTFEPKGSIIKPFYNPVDATFYAMENVDGFTEVHLIETNIKEWIVS